MSTNREQTKEFINTLTNSKGKTIYKMFTKGGSIYNILEEQAMSQQNICDVYFVGNMYENAISTNDDNIGDVYYIRIDVDIKKGLEGVTGITVTKEDIMSAIVLIKDAIDGNELFSEYSYIVYSGGGCHIYYSTIDNPLTLNKDDFKIVMKEIYKKFDKLLDSPGIEADKAVCNKARIMRLPGTYNTKYEDTKCEILYEKKIQSRFFKFAEMILVEGNKKIEADNKKAMEELKKRNLELLKQEGGAKQDFFYKKINSSIPAYMISHILLPEYKFDGKKNFINSKGKKTGFFYSETKNAICNGGSSHYDFNSNPDANYNNFALVRNFKGFTNAETFEYFKSLLIK